MLYLIKSYGPREKKIYKVGFTNSPNKRLDAYFYHNPYIEPISFREGDKELETLIHYCLCSFDLKFKKNGKLDEWFCGDLSTISYVFHLTKKKLKQLIWINRDKAFSVYDIKRINSDSFKLLEELYIEFKGKGLKREKIHIDKNGKLYETKASEVDLMFSSKYFSNQYYQSKTIKSNSLEYHDEEDKIVTDFLDNHFYRTNIFEEKMKMYCEFMDTYGNNSYIFAAIIHKIDPKYKTYYDLFGTSGCRAVRYEEASLRGRVSNNLKSSDLKEKLISYFKIGSKYELKTIKLTLKSMYLDLGITKTPKATELENYFNISETMITDSVTKKRNKGYLILGIK